jgi:acyl-[acyl-carrier-protein]-phospholipid O-acyltransferase/long-chain-fatty-acid--[acyl-carrier-protein] ligase
MIRLPKPGAMKSDPPSLPPHWQSLAHAFVHQARMQPRARALHDSTAVSLTYGQLLIRAIALANLLKHRLQEESAVGILLPPSAGAVLANLALSLLGKITVNLNYASGQKMLDSCTDQCRLKFVITSKRVIDRLGLTPHAQVILLEELQHEPDLLDKLKALIEAELIPEGLLGKFLPGLLGDTKQTSEASDRHEIKSLPRLNDPATVIFTAGSTGDPKGVLLSHSNILSNIQAIRQQGHIQNGEIVLGVIPFFHSFGLTMTLWACLCLGECVVYHYDPLDGRRIAQLCEKFKATTIVCTPTMITSYIRRSSPEQFASLKNCIVGGEKLLHGQFQDIKSKLGITPLEGYGLAETSPVVSCNVPGTVTLSDGRTVDGIKPGTVGLPVPGTQVRIVDPDSNEDLPSGKEGVILVHGPQVMIGYLDRPEATKAVLKNGWFRTGDMGFLDEEGFLTVTGRLTQFSKIGGEMVPHLAIQDELLHLTGKDAQSLCVTSIPDAKRGERLVVVYCELGETPQQLVEKMRATEVPRLWIPDTKDFVQVDKLPVLPNGKLDIRQVKQLAGRQSTAGG